MARPKNQERRQALLDAANRLIAEQGLGVSTSRIAQEAGVSEGSLFTYFKSKDALFDALFCQIQEGTRAAIEADFPRDADVRSRLWHLWSRFVGWGASRLHERQTLAKLRLSGVLRPESLATAASQLPEVEQLWRDAVDQGLLRDLPPDMVGAILKALGEMTMEQVARRPKDAERTLALGFEVLWGALRRPGPELQA